MSVNAAPTIRGLSTLPFLLLSIAIWAACLYRQQFSVLNEDVIWLLTAAGRLLDGGRFGTDVVEVNTPPSILLYLPSVLLSRAFGLSMALGHHLAVGAIALGPIAVMVRILQPVLAARMAQQWLWPIAQAAFIAFCVQVFQFGQRDNFVILFLLPLIALEAAPLGGARTAIVWQVLAGVLTAVALAIKPHYALVVVTFWGIRVWRLGFVRAVNAPDVRAAFVAGIVILALSLALFPEWLTMAGLAWRYYAFVNRSTPLLLAELANFRWPLFGIQGIALLVWWRLPISAPLRPLMTALFLAWPGLALGYLLQSKGFTYHLIPLEVATELLGLLAVISILHKSGASSFAAIGMSTALLAAAGAFSAPVITGGFPRPDFVQDDPVVAAIRKYDKGNGILALDVSASPAIYAVLLYGTRIASRAQCLWLLRPMVEVAANGAGAKADKARQDIDVLERGLVDDFQRYQPDLVLVNQAPVLADGSSFLTYLSRNPKFSRLWSGYRLAASEIWLDKSIDIYVKASR